jgi:hypothetical protein
MNRSRFIWVGLFLMYFSFVTVSSAHAYIDPGSGSYFFQLLVGGLLGAAVAVKVFWRRIWSFLTRRSREDAGTRRRED